MLISLLIFLCCGAIVGVLAGLLGMRGRRHGHRAHAPGRFSIRRRSPGAVWRFANSWPSAHPRPASCSLPLRQRPRPSQTRRGELGYLHAHNSWNPGWHFFAGGLIATHLAHNVPQDFLFICFLIAISCQMFANYRAFGQPPHARRAWHGLGWRRYRHGFQLLSALAAARFPCPS